MQENNQTVPLDTTIILTPDDALEQFESTGGVITVFNSFGEDPFDGRPDLIAQREAMFLQQHPDFTEIFSSTANGDYLPFISGLLNFIGISKTLVAQL